MKIERVAITSISTDPANVREHDDRNMDAIRGSLVRFGQQKPIVVDRDGIVRAGNGTYLAAVSLGWTEIDIVRTNLVGTNATAYSIADNRSGELSSWNVGDLTKLMQAIRDEDPALADELAFTDSELNALAKAAGGWGAFGRSDDVEDPGASEPPEVPVSQLGDLWILGGHRLLCGDSLDGADVTRLMNGETAALLATDPPYLVDYRGEGWDGFDGADEAEVFFTRWLQVALVHCSPNVPVYQWHAHRRQALVERAWAAAGLLLHQQIIWSKSHGVFGRSHFAWSHEPCFYGWPKTKMPDKGRKPPPSEMTVWNIPQTVDDKADHPTPKPLEIFTRPMEYHTIPGEVTLEPFSGSGSQIVAAQKVKRRCFAMELSPAYVDVAIERWQKATGQEAVLDGSQLTFATVAAERQGQQVEDAAEVDAEVQ